MFAWVVLGHFPLVAVSHVKKENKQTNKHIKISIPVY